jgi:dolichyl-phosphate-mannose--protein O-mannosyl transferase
VDNHDYQSPWYEWPLILKPMWFYGGTGNAGEGNVATIMCMGNPAVWWVGFGTFLYMLWRWMKPYLLLRAPKDHRLAMLLLAFAAQFVPWMLVPRSMFIYHYFGSLPFVMCGIVYAFERIQIKKPALFRPLQVGYMVIVLVLFIGFYPIATGIPIPRAWANAMNWLTFLKLPIWKYGRWLMY